MSVTGPREMKGVSTHDTAHIVSMTSWPIALEDSDQVVPLIGVSHGVILVSELILPHLILMPIEIPNPYGMSSRARSEDMRHARTDS
jgi:hypothetical protein